MSKLLALLSLLLLPLAARADLGAILAPSLDAKGIAVTRPLTLDQGQALLDHFGITGLPDEMGQSALVGLESVLHAKGGNYGTTTPATAASWLEGSTGHGAVFELEAARLLQSRGGSVVFIRTGNPGVDLRLTAGAGEPVSFFQAKAWKDASAGAESTFLDGLTFAGGEPATRVPNLLDGSFRFAGLVPKDQVPALIRSGQLLADGSPSPEFVASILDEAARRAAGTGENALRLRAVLPDAGAILPRMTLESVPITNDALLVKTAQAASDLRLAKGNQLTKSAGTIAAPAAKIGTFGKVLGGVGIVAGASQVYNGVQELQQGETTMGGLNLTGGAANTTSAMASLAGLEFLGGTTGAVGAGLDGALDIYIGIKHDDSEKLSVGAVKSAAALAMAAGTATGQPEVVIPAAVVYGGAAVTDVAYEHREAISQFFSTAAADARANLNDAALGIYQYTPDTIKTNRYFLESYLWLQGF